MRRDHLRGLGGWSAERAGLRTGRGLGDLVADDHPGAGDGIFAEFHGGKENKMRAFRQCGASDCCNKRNHLTARKSYILT